MSDLLSLSHSSSRLTPFLAKKTTSRSPRCSSGIAVTTRSRAAEDFVDHFFDLHMRHHLAADLAEARQTVGDRDEAVLVDGRDIAGDIPAAAHRLVGEVLLIQVAEHDIGSFDEQQPGFAWAEGFAAIGIDRPWRRRRGADGRRCRACGRSAFPCRRRHRAC